MSIRVDEPLWEVARLKYNRITLLKACEALIRRSDFTLKLRTINPKSCTAHVTYTHNLPDSPCDFVVTIDGSQGGLIESLLHETLHIVLHEEIGGNFNGALEETLIKSLERDLWIKAFKPPVVRRWRLLLKEKLND